MFPCLLEARDNVVAAFHAAGIPLKKLQHPSIQGLLGTISNLSGCYPKDDKNWKVFLFFSLLALGVHCALIDEVTTQRSQPPHISCFSQDSNPRVLQRHIAAIRDRLRDLDVCVCFDEWTDKRGKTALNIVIWPSRGRALLSDVIFLECMIQGFVSEPKAVFSLLILPTPPTSSFD